MDAVVMEAINTHGWVLGLMVSLPVIMAGYKKPIIQAMLPAHVRWENMNMRGKMLTLFVTSALGAGAAAFATGAGLPTAIVGGIIAGFAASGAREMGEKLKEEKVDGAIERLPGTSLRTKIKPHD